MDASIPHQCMCMWGRPHYIFAYALGHPAMLLPEEMYKQGLLPACPPPLPHACGGRADSWRLRQAEDEAELPRDALSLFDAALFGYSPAHLGEVRPAASPLPS